jgi:hypothetical protein
VGAASWLRQVMKDEMATWQGKRSNSSLTLVAPHDGAASLSNSWHWSNQLCTVERHWRWNRILESTTRCYPRCRSNPLQLAAWLRRRQCSTPNSMFFGQPNTILQLEPHNIEDTDLRKRAKYLQKCKDAIWRRWTKEYLRSLCTWEIQPKTRNEIGFTDNRPL